MGLVIKVDGTDYEVKPNDGKKFTNTEIQSHVGCEWFEHIGLADGRDMWFDEEGKHRMKLDNFRASDLLNEAGGIFGDYIAGTVLITDPGEVE